MVSLLPMRTVIVGGVAGGMSAATRLRRLDEHAEIVVFERGDYVSFANCGLPYFVGGIIADRSALLLQTPQSLAARFRIEVQTGWEVVAIDRASRIVTVRDVHTGVRRAERYDNLVLAGGAMTALERVDDGIPTFTLRTIDDVDQITATLDARSDSVTGTAVVIGAGFIGLEAVENLVHRGLSVVLVQRNSQVMSPLDPEMAALVLQRLEAAEVDVRLSTTVLSESDGVLTLSDGTTLTADLVISASGVYPDTSLARDAGLRIGESGGIWVDAQQRTSDEHVFAVGDGTEKTDAVDGHGTLVAMAGLANRHGRAAADTIAGVPTDTAPSLGTSIVGLFDLTIGMLGWSEHRLVAAGRPARVIHTHPDSHATYYPGADQMHIKLLVDPITDAILGAQIIGGAGVDKRIDILATAMAGGITASGLSRLELAYAPQYGSAKDPINQLGYVADNLAHGAVTSVQWHELDAAVARGETLVDVRSAAEFAAESIPGALNIPLDQLRMRLDELPNSPLVVHCKVGQRGHTAARLISQYGFVVRNLDGGYLTWSDGRNATESSLEHERITR